MDARAAASGRRFGPPARDPRSRQGTGATLAPLANVLDGYPEFAQAKAAAWRRRVGADHLPEQFIEVLDGVLRFADQPLRAEVNELTWAPDTGTWQN
jgi:hypothetical protein